MCVGATTWYSSLCPGSRIGNPLSLNDSRFIKRRKACQTVRVRKHAAFLLSLRCRIEPDYLRQPTVPIRPLFVLGIVGTDFKPSVWPAIGRGRNVENHTEHRC
jgi:hypothetical protein